MPERMTNQRRMREPERRRRATGARLSARWEVVVSGILWGEDRRGW
jgi:hypothetical protein